MSRALFAEDELVRRRARQLAKRRPKLSLPDGKPRTFESNAERDARLREEARQTFFIGIVQSAKARLDLLKNRNPLEFVACPWCRLGECSRCSGGEVSIAQLTAHYARMASEYTRLCKPRTTPPPPPKREPKRWRCRKCGEAGHYVDRCPS